MTDTTGTPNFQELHEITRYVICPVCRADAPVWDEKVLDCGECGFAEEATR